MMRLTLAVPLGVVLSASAAFACGNSLRENARPSLDEALVAAQLAFKAGDFHRAAFLGMQAQTEGGETGRVEGKRVAGLAFLKLGEFTKAATQLEGYLQQKKEPFARVKLAEARLRSPEASPVTKGRALAELEKLAAEDLVSDADALAALARARLDKGDAPGARQACEQALQIDPGHAAAARLLSSLQEPPARPTPTQPVKLNSKS